MRSILLLAAAAMGLLCAFGEPSESASKPTEPGSFEAWATSEAARLEAAQAIQTASAPVKATPREGETPADEIVVEEPPDGCPCGPGCTCPDCQCLNQSPDVGRLPRLRVTVWDQGCPRCEAFKSEAMAELGWSVGGPESLIELVTVPGGLESSPPAPLFEYVTGSGVESWVGYGSRDEFMGRLRRAMGLPFEPLVKTAVQTGGSASQTGGSVVPVGHHSHRCNACGTVWSHDGTGDHYREHSCPSCGRYQNVIYQGQPARQTRGTYYAPAVRQRGFFGRLLRGGCANGNCGR